METKTKKILIYGGVGVGIIGGGIYLYLKYFNNKSNKTNTTITQQTSPETINTTGMGGIVSMVPYYDSYPAPPEIPITSSTQGNTSPIINPAPKQGSGTLNSFVQQEINQSNNLNNTQLTQYIMPAPSTPNLNLPNLQQLQPSKIITNSYY